MAWAEAWGWGRWYNLRRMKKVEDLELSGAERRVLRMLKSRLVKLMGKRLKAMRVFGSKARGDAGPHSDLDVFVMVAGLTRGEKRAILDVIVELEVKYICVMSTLIMSEEEFCRLKKLQRRIALDIEKEGVPV